MSNCIFCKIVAGEIPAHKVGESERAIAFLDLHPIRPGHTLVIPKVHAPNFQDLAPEDYQAVMALTQQVAKQIEQKLQPKRVGMMTIGWDVPHTHVHVVPMQEPGDITSKVLLEKRCGEPTTQELAGLARLLTL
ncbi:MAG: HIT domain-containing protein [Patescibacteria group bacterium]